MNGWVKVLGEWHQAEYDSRTNSAVLSCTGQLRIKRIAGDVMDYRWRPYPSEQCQEAECQAKVEP